MVQYFYDQKGKDTLGWKSAIDHYFKLKRKINRNGDHIIESGYIEFKPAENKGEEDVYKLTINLAHKKKVCNDCNGEGHVNDPVLISTVYENCCPKCNCSGFV